MKGPIVFKYLLTEVLKAGFVDELKETKQSPESH